MVRAWALAVEADCPSTVSPTTGVVVVGRRPPLVLVRVERESLTEAMGAACAALLSRNGKPPFVHRAWRC
jgi:hypothetical protein